MKNKNKNLIQVYILKEKIHWTRMRIGFNNFNTLFSKIIGGVILSTIISIFHYIFATPHFIMECIMFLFVRGQYRMNMKNLYGGGLRKLVVLHQELDRFKK